MGFICYSAVEVQKKEKQQTRCCKLLKSRKNTQWEP